MKKLLVSALIGMSVLATSAFATYNKGFKYYTKYIKKKTGIKSVKLLKILNIQTESELKKLIFDNWNEFKAKLKEYLVKEKGWTEKEVDKLFKTGAWHKLEKHKKDLYNFLKGIYEGKIPAGCS